MSDESDDFPPPRSRRPQAATIYAVRAETPFPVLCTIDFLVELMFALYLFMKWHDQRR